MKLEFLVSVFVLPPRGWFCLRLYGVSYLLSKNPSDTTNGYKFQKTSFHMLSVTCHVRSKKLFFFRSTFVTSSVMFLEGLRSTRVKEI